MELGQFTLKGCFDYELNEVPRSGQKHYPFQLCTPLVMLEVNFQSVLARNCIKCPDLHYKSSLPALIPSLEWDGWFISPKTFLPGTD